MDPVPVYVEHRIAATETTSVPSGTMLNAPSAKPTGDVPNAPVVAVETQRWWTSIQFWGALIGFPALDAVSEFLVAGGQFDRNRIFHIALSAALGAYLAYRRKTVNTVLK